MIKTIEWTTEGVVMIDQTKLPAEEVYLTCRDYQETADAIRNMVIRGAPAIGVAAAMGVARGVCDAVDQADATVAPEQLDQSLDQSMETICETLAATRPTAVNLFWAIERMKNLYGELREQGASRESDPRSACRRSAADARGGHRNQQVDRSARGRVLLPAEATVMTHCNAGALATAGYGTALGVIRAAVEGGNPVAVLANETRPFMQGARLTVWELQQDNIPVTLLTDNMAGHVLHGGSVGAIVVGADRIAGNGERGE